MKTTQGLKEIFVAWYRMKGDHEDTLVGAYTTRRKAEQAMVRTGLTKAALERYGIVQLDVK
jgi:hypothetical protein